MSENNKLPVLDLVSEQMRQVIRKQEELAGPFDTTASMEQIRENYTKERVFWNEGGPEPDRVEDRQVATEYGAVNIRCYLPTPTGEPSPVMVYIHGGGWVVGNLDTHDRICRQLQHNTGHAVVAVDYTLSPEATYPQPIKEVATVVKYLRENATELAIDPERMGFAGDSGGANLSLGTYLYMRDQQGGAPFIRALLLYYGAFGLKDSMSQRLLGGKWDGLTEADLKYYYNLYAPNDEDKIAPYFDVFRADLTKDVPPCYVAAAQYDPLVDDSRTLAAILEQNGLTCELEVFEKVIHAFLHHSRMLDAALDAMAHGAQFWKKHV